MNTTSLTKLKPFAKIGLIVAGLLATVILITIIIALLTQKKTQYTPPNPIPSFEPKKITQPAQFTNELAKIKPFLPYKGQGYSIEFLAQINAINIKVTASSPEEFLTIKKNAENYIKQKGVNNICSLNIFWIPLIDSATRQKLRATDFITSSCPAIAK